MYRLPDRDIRPFVVIFAIPFKAHVSGSTRVIRSNDMSFCPPGTHSRDVPKPSPHTRPYFRLGTKPPYPHPD